MTELTGEELLERLEAGLIDPNRLTTEQREQVMLAQENRITKQREQFKLRKDKRTRFGLGSWRYPTDTALKEAKRKAREKKLRM